MTPRANVQKVGSSGVGAAAELSRPLSACWLTAAPANPHHIHRGFLHKHVHTRTNTDTHTLKSCRRESDIRKPDKRRFDRSFKRKIALVPVFNWRCV